MTNHAMQQKYKLFRLFVLTAEDREKFKSIGLGGHHTHLITVRVVDDKGNKWDSPIQPIECSMLRHHVRGILEDMAQVINDFENKTGQFSETRFHVPEEAVKEIFVTINAKRREFMNKYTRAKFVTIPEAHREALETYIKECRGFIPEQIEIYGLKVSFGPQPEIIVG